jgi:hypothetical protein
MPASESWMKSHSAAPRKGLKGARQAGRQSRLRKIVDSKTMIFLGRARVRTEPLARADAWPYRVAGPDPGQGCALTERDNPRWDRGNLTCRSALGGLGFILSVLLGYRVWARCRCAPFRPGKRGQAVTDSALPMRPPNGALALIDGGLKR